MKNYTLFEQRKNEPERKVFDLIAENHFEAFDTLRKLSYGLHTIGLETTAEQTSGGNLSLEIKKGKRTVTYILVEQ